MFKDIRSLSSSEQQTVLDGINAISRLYLPGTEVTPELFGAKGDGVTDDSSPIQTAASIPGAVVRFTSGKIYCASNIIPAIGVTLRGDAGRSGGGYTTQNLVGRPVIRALPNPTTDNIPLINYVGGRGLTVRGLTLDGLDEKGSLISDGGSRLTVDKCNLYRGLYGLGGRLGDGYTRTMQISDTMIANCGNGMLNPVDSFFTLVHFAANRSDNIRAESGANTNAFSACRFEWSERGRLIEAVGGSTPVTGWDFVGCQWDRGWLGSFVMGNVRFFSIVGGLAKRSNRSVFSEPKLDTDNTLFYMNNSSEVSIIGINMAQGKDDSGGPVQTLSPDYGITIGPGNDRITIIGNTFDPNFVAPIRTLFNANPTRLIIRNNPGVPDFANDPLNLQVNGPDHYRDIGSIGTLAPGASATVTLNTRVSLVTFSARALKLRVVARRTDNVGTLTGDFLLGLRREGTVAAAVLTDQLSKRATLPAAYTAPTVSNPPTQTEVQALANAVAALNAFVRSPPDIGLSGFGMIQVSLGTVAEDGSTVQVTVTNPTTLPDGSANTRSYSIPRMTLL